MNNWKQKKLPIMVTIDPEKKSYQESTSGTLLKKFELHI